MRSNFKRINQASHLPKIKRWIGSQGGESNMQPNHKPKSRRINNHGISINTNIAASRASHFLTSNHANLQKSLDRLSSGRRITEPADDAGGLAVAMKLNHSIQGLSGASKNIGNAISSFKCRTESFLRRNCEPYG